MTDLEPDDWDDDYGWSDPLPDGTRHAMGVDDDGLLVCCGTSPLSIPAGDWMTADPARITCTGTDPANR